MRSFRNLRRFKATCLKQGLSRDANTRFEHVDMQKNEIRFLHLVRISL